jgi:hypothetical protein
MDRSVEKTISAADIIDRNQIDGLGARPTPNHDLANGNGAVVVTCELMKRGR